MRIRRPFCGSSPPSELLAVDLAENPFGLECGAPGNLDLDVKNVPATASSSVQESTWSLVSWSPGPTSTKAIVCIASMGPDFDAVTHRAGCFKMVMQRIAPLCLPETSGLRQVSISSAGSEEL